MTQTGIVQQPFPVLAFALSGLELLRRPAWLGAVLLFGCLALVPMAAFVSFALAPSLVRDNHAAPWTFIAAFAVFAIGGFIWSVLLFGFQARVFRNVLGLNWRINLWNDGWAQFNAQRSARFRTMGPILLAWVFVVAGSFAAQNLGEPWRRLAWGAAIALFAAAILYTSVRGSLIGVVAYAGPRNLESMGQVVSRAWEMTRGSVVPLALMLVVSWLVSFTLIFAAAALVFAGLWAAGAPEAIAARIPSITHATGWISGDGSSCGAGPVSSAAASRW